MKKATIFLSNWFMKVLRQGERRKVNNSLVTDNQKWRRKVPKQQEVDIDKKSHADAFAKIRWKWFNFSMSYANLVAEEKNDSSQIETSPPVLCTRCAHDGNNSCSSLEEKDTTGNDVYRFKLFDLVCFITRVPDTSDTSATQTTRVQHEKHETNTSETRVTQVRHKCNTSATRTTRVWHECSTNDRSATLVRNFDFDNDTSENIFHTPILAIWQMKDYNERNNFILRNTFWKCLVPMPKCIWEACHKNWTL